MSREASFLIDCSSYSDSIVKIITALNTVGWKHSNEQTEYLPLHDNDNFDWQNKPLIDEELFFIISQKQKYGELCGLVLNYQFSDIGITLLARNTKEIMFNIDINRKTMCGDYTDVSWYIEMIVSKLEKIGCMVKSLKYSEIIG